jgi:hypothetical protein
LSIESKISGSHRAVDIMFPHSSHEILNPEKAIAIAESKHAKE